MAKTIAYANEHLDEVKAAGAPLAGLTPEQAAALPLTRSTEVSQADLQALIDLMITFGWITSAPDLSSFLK